MQLSRNALLLGGLQAKINASACKTVQRPGRRNVITYAGDAEFGYLDGDFQEGGNKNLSAGLEWLNEQKEEVEFMSTKEDEEVELVRSVGLERSARGVREIDETDSQRFPWHRKLKACAERGDYSESETIVEDMRKFGLIPGPLAFHAFVLSYVKAGHPHGALGAIRKAYDAGIQPTPTTYAAIIHAFLKIGDFNRAEAVYASNRRAGVDSSKSWAVLLAGMLRLGEAERSLALLDQGEAEGLTPDSAIYERVIKLYSMENRLDDAWRKLNEMRERQLEVQKVHISPIVTAAALSGRIEDAEQLFVQLLRAPGRLNAATIGAVNALLQGYLAQNLAHEDLAFKVSGLRELLAKNNIGTDRKGYSLYLEAGLYLNDLRLAMYAFKALKSQAQGCLQYVTDELLTGLLMELCKANRPADIFDVLETLTLERRNMPQAAMYPAEDGRTILTSWFNGEAGRSSDERKPQTSSARYVVGNDGIRLDSESLCAVDDEGDILPPTKMTVRQLRAELEFRDFPSLRGSKKDLQKKLGKARADAQASQDPSAINTKGKKVEVMLVEESWAQGKLVAEHAETAEVDKEDDDNADDDNIDQAEFEDEEAVVLKTEGADDFDEEEDGDTDYDDKVASWLKAQGGHRLEWARFSNEQAGVLEATHMLDLAMELGATPSKADVAVLASALDGEYSLDFEAVAEILLRALNLLPDGDRDPVIESLVAKRSVAANN